LIFCEGLEIDFQRCYRGLQFMREVVDEGVLEAVELKRLEVVDEDDEDAQHDDDDQQRKAEDHHPGLGLEKLISIQLIAPDHRFQVFADPDVPVYVEKKGDRQRDRGEDEDKNRMDEPLCLFHLQTSLYFNVTPRS
jgi:hypothetical protein